MSLLGSKHGFFSSYSITVLILHLFYCIPNPTAPTPPAATGSATVSYSSVTKTDLCDPALDPYKNIQPLDMLRRFVLYGERGMLCCIGSASFYCYCKH